jgi:cytidyltransferase-like protein
LKIKVNCLGEGFCFDSIHNVLLALLDVYNKPRETPLDSFQLTDQAKAESNTTPLTENTGPIEPLVFERVAVGGTFDHLHAGHKILLTMTALLARQSMVVGVTDDCMLTKKKHRELIASTSERIQSVKDYMQRIKRTISYEVVPIKDPFGPTVTDPTIDALVVSKETLKGGDLGKEYSI